MDPVERGSVENGQETRAQLQINRIVDENFCPFPSYAILHFKDAQKHNHSFFTKKVSGAMLLRARIGEPRFLTGFMKIR